MVINFESPIEFGSVYLKQHRAPNFYLKSSIGKYEIHGYFQGRTVLNATILAGNTVWKQYSPSDHLVLDKLVIHAGLDIDNLLLKVDSPSLDYLI